MTQKMEAVAAAEQTYEQNRVFLIFNGSDGEATQALYDELAGYGPIGLVAINLFRAQKCSIRAKLYTSGHYSTLAYGRKGWSMTQLTTILQRHGPDLGIVFGWGHDPTQPRYPWVLYVDLPQGQVSFHAPVKGDGPFYAGRWDGMVEASTGRILRFVNTVLKQEESIDGVTTDGAVDGRSGAHLRDLRPRSRRVSRAQPGRRTRVRPRRT